MGPPVSAAFDAEGHPTNAGLGFARKLGADFDALVAGRHAEGQVPVLSEATFAAAPRSTCCRICSASVLRDLTFPKQMHWDAQLEDGKGELLFGRPIRWLLFLYGGRVVPFTIARSALASSPRVQDVTSGAVTYGHRFLATSGRAGRAIKVRSFDEYRKKLTENFVLLSRIDRRDRIVPRPRGAGAPHRRTGDAAPARAGRGAARGGARIWSSFRPSSSGAFSAEFLTLPEEVLTTTLIHHQHFFPVVAATGGADAGVSRRHQHADDQRSRDLRPTPSAW